MTVLIAPRISEKAVALAERGQYVFDVPMDANKDTVARAVKTRFKVDVAAVNMSITKGRLVRFKRTMGRRADVKKAVVTLKKGQTITLFEGAK